MQTLSFSINGSYFLLISLLVVILLFTIYSYRRCVPPINFPKKIILIVLRVIALSLLLFAIFEPIFTSTKSNEVEPKIAVLFDNSISMSIKDAGGNRLGKYKKAIIDSKILNNQDNMIFGTFDNELIFKKNFNIDSLKLNGESSDLSSALSSVNFLKESDNVRSIIMFTDGAFNKGNNPIYDAEKSSKKIYVVGIGDTALAKDILLHSLLTNEIAYIDNILPINVNINHTGYDGAKTKLAFYENDKLIEEKEINLVSGTNSLSSYFEYSPKSEGTKKLSFRVIGFEDEITKKNNTISKYVKVLKNKRRISIFAGYSTPDISFFKTAIKDQKGIEINEYIQKLGSDFYNTPSEKDLAETELFVFIAFPVNTSPDLLLEQIKKQLALGKPILFIGGLKTDYQKLKKIEDFLPFITASSQSREFEVLPDFYPQSLSNSLLRIDGTDNDLEKWNKLTPIFRTETFVRVKPESEIIAGIKINNTPLKEPLIVTRDLQSKKSLAVLGYGLYRWKLTGYAEEISKQRNSVHDLYQIFITNAIRWLSVSEQSRRIRIQPIKDFFSVDEPIEFIAQIYDAAYTPIDDANVVVKIETKDGIREQVFSQISNGRYFASFDNLGMGDFKFSGKAEKNDKNIGNDEGRFSIGGLNAEYRDLVMNYNLLSNIAKYTNGKFYFSDDVSNILKDVKGDPNFKPLINTSRFDYLIWNNAWLMALAILLLSLEWFLRKRAGLL